MLSNKRIKECLKRINKRRSETVAKDLRDLAATELRHPYLFRQVKNIHLKFVKKMRYLKDLLEKGDK